MVILMNARNYSTICRLLFPQPEHPESAALNGRTLLTNAVAITDEGNLHSGLNGGRTVFRSPTTPRLEYLSAFDTGVFVKITYVGTLHIQFWGYPPEQSGRLMEEHWCTASRLDTHYLPVTFDTCSSGYFDIHINFQNEGVVFSLSLVREYPQISCNDLYDLSRCVFPKKHLCTEEQLYFRLPDDAGYYSYKEEYIALFPHKYVEFSTYFNAFSCGKWAAYTTVQDLSACLEFQGTCLVEVWHALSEEVHHKVYADIHTHDMRGEIHIPLGTLSTFETGILYLKIYSFGHSRIYGGYYATGTPKTSEVHLGIVITTYKREEDVKKTVATLSGTLPVLVEDPIALVVVDNGQTLRPEDVTGATLLPNRNLGGSGGFMRGLIHLEDVGRVTHCLFMDDDAFCEPESIARTRALLMYRREDNLSVAGAMLLKEHMHIQHENTAYYTTVNHPIGNGMDLNKIINVIENEYDYFYKNKYAAWWFFAFPLNYVKNYSFPFFVKGDDILFSIKNEFSILTMNGICSWQENFLKKHNLIAEYLSLRSICIINNAINNKTKNLLYILRIFISWVSINMLCYNYNASQVMIKAFKDFLKGPDFFCKNVQASNIFENIKTDIEEYKKNKILYKDMLNKYEHAEAWRPNGIRQIFTIIFTCCGHLLPNVFIYNKKNKFLYKEERFWMSAFYRNRYINIYDNLTMTMYTLEMDRKKFFKLLMESFIVSVKFTLSYFFLKKKYDSLFNYMTSKEFWVKCFYEK